MKKTYKLLAFVFLALFAVGCGQCDKYAHPEWSYNAVMYELNTRQFTEEGTFTAAESHIPRLKELGVDIIWFMPIQPIGVEERKGELGSYYSISDYTAINPEFGTLDDFSRFVSTAHSHDMKVIIDWVANHTSRDAKWLVNDGWYVMNEDGTPNAPYDWSDVAELNYDNNDMRAEMIESMRFWLTETGIDGFRCDVAHDVPTDFWKSAINSLKRDKKDLFMLAEAEKPELHTVAGFDASYAWELHHIMNQMAQGAHNLDSLRGYLVREAVNHPADAIRLAFTSNHDENSWNGTEFERMGDAAKAFAVFSYVIPGMPLIYNGQEVGFDRRLEFFTKDEIDWIDRGGYTEFYTTLNDFKHRNAAIAAGEKGGELQELANTASDKVFSFVREADGDRVVALFNFSPSTVEFTVTMPDFAGPYVNVLNATTTTLSAESTHKLAPWGYTVYEN